MEGLGGTGRGGAATWWKAWEALVEAVLPPGGRPLKRGDCVTFVISVL